MLIPLRWLEKYIKLKHSDTEFGEILTMLDSMQDGPIKEINGYPVIDLEVRQNRPDLLSIIGIAREYSAYINEPVDYPEQLDDIDIGVDWTEPDTVLDVKSTDIVKRFVTVTIKDVKVKRSPKWLKDELESYGIPSINNIVDITNYVMLEYGMPLHAFDKSKLKTEKGHSLLTLRKAKSGELFETWQGTSIELTNKDIVVADAKRTVAIAGVIGGANSGIDKKTTTIILESATYNHASIRRTAIRHNIITDASLRHSKFLNPNMCETAIRRALYLIKELSGGEIVKIEDYFNEKDKNAFANRTIDFDINQIMRLVGVQLETEKIIEYLQRLGFSVIEQKESIGIDKHLLIVKIPDWRTDITYEEDVVEEVARLWGYDKIPMQQINNAPQDNSTPKILILDEKIKDILIGLGYDEQITNPLCKYTDSKTREGYQQIRLENSLTSDLDGLRTDISQTLQNAVTNSIKMGVRPIRLFESGKIYWQHKVGDYREERRITILTHDYEFKSLKADILALLNKLGLSAKAELVDDELQFTINKVVVAILTENKAELMLENLVNIVNTDLVPFVKISTNIVQTITQEISLKLNEKIKLGDIANIIRETVPNGIDSIIHIPNDMQSVENFKIVFQSETNNLTRAKIQNLMSQIRNNLEKKLPIQFRS